MHTPNGNSKGRSTLRFWPVAGAALLTLALFEPASNAQTAQAKPQACVLPQMSHQIAPDGRGVRVEPARELTGPRSGQKENEKGIAATQNPENDRKLQEARAWFEKGARKGYPPAEVNLAAAALAGWGGSSNAGTALYWLQEAAKQDYTVAYFDLGIVYMHGCGVPQDYQQAAKYFALGANADHAASQMNLGYLYDHGLGVTQNRATAANWYRKAADEDEPSAQYNLADLYLRGEGVPQDDALAFLWFQKSATQGHSTARIMLGSLYAAGRGTSKDLQAAYQWLTAARLLGDARANTELAAIESQLSPEQIAQAKSRAESLTPSIKAAGEVALLH